MLCEYVSDERTIKIYSSVAVNLIGNSVLFNFDGIQNESHHLFVTLITLNLLINKEKTKPTSSAAQKVRWGGRRTRRFNEFWDCACVSVCVLLLWFSLKRKCSLFCSWYQHTKFRKKSIQHTILIKWTTIKVNLKPQHIFLSFLFFILFI